MFKDAALARATPVSKLKTRYPQRAQEIDAFALKTGVPVEKLAYLPVVGRKHLSWIAVLNKEDARIVGFLEFDVF